jgi:pilus assembly protein CpaC
VPAETAAPRRVQRVRPAQHIGAGGKPLPREILAMPKVRETLEVVHHRSQLLIARGNIVRTAIADDSVIDIVQFSPREISIIGVGLGSTTLTIWFDNNPDPLIYLVKTIRDPDIDEQLRLDYGKLERKLTALFPNSKVYLIPLSGKIVVKGQARDAREAAMILQIVRNEVINQNGSLFGPQPAGAVAVTAAGPGGIARAGFPGPNPYPGSQGANGAYGRGGGAFSPFDLASSYIVNMLEVPGEFQVMLRVRIAELNRSQLQRMGVDFSYLFNNGRHAISYALGGIPSTITGIFENGEVNVLIDWLSSNGTAKILSEPVITVLSGHTASMLSGGEFAVPTIVGIGGAQGQQTTFRGFGTSLFVTPTVTDKDLIRMTIVPEFSSINQGNAVNGIPGVDARRVQTTVELREGQTIAIAGLIAHQLTTEVARIPFLSDLPYIGPTLFAAKRSTMEETELLILVTPQLVRPMDADEVPPVPGWYVTPPAEHPLYFKGVTEGPPDLEYYQLAPYGRGAGMGEPVGYRLHNPSPATPGYPPAVTDPYGASRPGLPASPPLHTTPHGQTMPRQYTPNQTAPPQSYRNFAPPPQYNRPPAGEYQPPQQSVPNIDNSTGGYQSDPSTMQPPNRSLGNLFGLGR